MKRLGTITALLLAFLLLLTSCSQDLKKPVGTCGGREILMEELRHYALTHLDKHPDCTEEELRTAVGEEFCEQYALLSLFAEYLPDRSIDGDEMKQWAKEELNRYMDSMGGKSEFKKKLKELYLTEELFLRFLCTEQLRLELKNKLFAGTELENTDALLAWLDSGNYVRVRSITLPADRFTAADASVLAIAIQGGADPEQLLSQEQLQNGAKLNQPQYFFRGMQATEQELAALSLASVGDVSDVITASDAHTLLIRVDNDRDTLVEFQLTTIYDRYCTARMETLIAEKIPTVSLVWNEFGQSTVLRDLT